jgi:hypothetical protein
VIVGTHGRAIYVLDDAAPLGALTTELAASELHVFPPRAAMVFQQWKHESYSAQRVFIGPNPPFGAILTYYLKSGQKEPAGITIRDAAGAVVRNLEGKAEAGLNRVVWDLRRAAPPALTNQRGPLVVPGTYTATVSTSRHESKATITVVPDPAIAVSDAERQLRHQFLTDVLNVNAALAQAGNDVRAVREQLTGLEEQLKRTPGAAATVVEGTARLDKSLADLQARVGGGGGGGGEEGGGGGGGLRGRANGLFSELDGSGIHQGTLTGPTQGQRQRLEALRSDAATLRTAIDRALDVELTTLNTEIQKQNVPRIVRPR